MANELTAAAQRLLRDEDGQATQRYQDYLDHQAAYRAARQVYDDALADAQRDPTKLQAWPVTGMSHQRHIDEAYERWLALGSKSEVENALAVLRAEDHPTPPPKNPPVGSRPPQRRDQPR